MNRIPPDIDGGVPSAPEPRTDPPWSVADLRPRPFRGDQQYDFEHDEELLEQDHGPYTGE